MKQLVKQSKKKYINLNYLFSFFILFIILSIAINPQKYSIAAFKGLEVWVKILVPALFPFFVLTRLFSASLFIDDFTKLLSPITKKAYKCPNVSSYIFLMSIITGYPFGAKLITDNYYDGNISKNDAIKTLSFCSNSGPMFILGSVGIGMFANKSLGLIIYFSHILGALINGLLYRNYNKFNEKKVEYQKNNQIISNKTKVNFTDSITSSTSSIMLIGGVICFCFVLIEVITTNQLYLNILQIADNAGINSNVLNAFISGLFEITNGCLMFSNIPLSLNFIAPICTFIISFGGISTLLQSLALSKDIIPTKIFVIQKISHAICSTIVCLLFMLVF